MMMLDTSRFVRELEELYGHHADGKRQMEVALVLLKVWNRGMIFERERIKAIIKRRHINASAINAEIDRPVQQP